MHSSAKKFLESFLAEDIGAGDITSKILPRKRITAKIISRESGIVAGVSYAKEIFVSRKCTVKTYRRDGESVTSNQRIMTISDIDMTGKQIHGFLIKSQLCNRLGYSIEIIIKSSLTSVSSPEGISAMDDLVFQSRTY